MFAILKVAIVILNWNGQQLLKEFLPSITAHSSTTLSDVYVVDNASTDDSITYIKQHFPTVKIIKNPKNEGYAKGYNDALKQIEASIYVLVNSDVQVTKNWLEPVINHFDQNPNTAIIQPKILDYNNKEQFEYAGAAGGFIDKFGFPYCRGRIFNTIEKDKNQYKNSSVFWASGACLFIRSSVFKNLNGFDERYFAHFEEIDLCWRAHHLNYDISYVGESTIYHIGGATLKETNPKKTYLNYRNSLFTLVKNLPDNKLFTTIYIRLTIDGIAGVKFLFDLKPKHTFAILKAHASFYYHLYENLKIRKSLPSKKKQYYKTKSIVWKYFVKGKKTFNNLD